MLDDVIEQGPPCDIGARLLRPFATRVALRVIGVPPQDEAMIASWSDAVRSDAGRSEIGVELQGYLGELLMHKRRSPSNDALSDLAHNCRRRAPSDESLMIRAAELLLLGYETAAARTTYGVLSILAHPRQQAALARDASLVPTAVEEILRFAVPGGSWIPRYALADIEYGAASITAGELVVFAIQAANRDELEFVNPAVFDIARQPNPHVGFGHGKFFCLGATTTLMIMQIVTKTLFARLPTLCLTMPVESLPLDTGKITGGLAALPVSWS